MYLKFKKEETFKTWENFEEALKILENKRVFVMDESEIHDFRETTGKECDIFINPGTYLPALSYYSIAYRKDFPLRKMFDYYIVKFKQSGLYDRLGKIYLPPKLQNCPSTLQEADLQATILIFFSLGAGVTIAVFLLILEIVLVAIKKRKV